MNLSTATSAKLKVHNPDGTLIIDGALTIEDQTTATGWVNRAWQTTDTDEAGVYRCEVEITWADGTKQTFPPNLYGAVVITQDLG